MSIFEIIGKKMKRNSHSGYAGQLRVSNVLLRADLLGKSLPQFNLKGETSVNTLIGGVLSILILCQVIGYGTIKAIELTSRNNPSIVETHTDQFEAGKNYFDNMG